MCFNVRKLYCCKRKIIFFTVEKIFESKYNIHIFRKWYFKNNCYFHFSWIINKFHLDLKIVTNGFPIFCNSNNNNILRLSTKSLSAQYNLTIFISETLKTYCITFKENFDTLIGLMYNIINKNSNFIKSNNFVFILYMKKISLTVKKLYNFY